MVGRKIIRKIKLRVADAGPPWQEVVSLRCAGQAVVQAIAEDTDGLGLAYREKPFPRFSGKGSSRAIRNA